MHSENRYKFINICFNPIFFKFFNFLSNILILGGLTFHDFQFDKTILKNNNIINFSSQVINYFPLNIIMN